MVFDPKGRKRAKGTKKNRNNEKCGKKCQNLEQKWKKWVENDQKRMVFSIKFAKKTAESAEMFGQSENIKKIICLAGRVATILLLL